MPVDGLQIQMVYFI